MINISINNIVQNQYFSAGSVFLSGISGIGHAIVKLDICVFYLRIKREAKKITSDASN